MCDSVRLLFFFFFFLQQQKKEEEEEEFFFFLLVRSHPCRGSVHPTSRLSPPSVEPVTHEPRNERLSVLAND